MDKKPNILFLLHLPPPVHGSSVVGKAIKDSKLINGQFDCRFINLLVSRKLNDTGKKSFSKVFRSLGTSFSLFKEILKKKPDLCYFALTTTGFGFYKDVISVAILRLFHVKRVYHLHNKGVSKAQSGIINALLYRFVFNRAKVILLSKYLYPDIQKFVPKSQVYICPNGISDNIPEVTKHVSKPKEKIKILFLSNLIKSKGVFVLLDACSIMKKNGYWFECDFVGGEGDVSEQEFKEKVVQKGLSENVRYLGMKFDQEKEAIYSRADIFAFPTYYEQETFGLVNLEAMENSIPIVSTFEGGIPDVVENGVTGFLVPQQNVKALEEKLEILIKDPLLREKMGKLGRQKFEQEFTLDKFEKRLTKILLQICTEN